jgi:AcrR family transcriptional regulator
MAPNPARRNESTRLAVLAAAIELLEGSGFDALTIEAIAKRAGVGKQTIYRWWPSKGAVVLDAFLEHVVEARADVPAAAPADTGDFATDLRRMVHATVAEFATPRFESPYRAMIVAMQADPWLADRASDLLIRPSLAGVRTWLAGAQDAGQVRDDVDLDVAVEMIFGPLFHRWLLRTAPLTPAYADALADAAIRTLA